MSTQSHHCQLWDTEAPEPPHYFAAQRECQNAALFQMMQAAVSKQEADLGPILVDPSPETRDAAVANLLSFSDENVPPVVSLRTTNAKSKLQLNRSMPPWMLPPVIKIDKVPRFIDELCTYTALVYEFVEPGQNNLDTVQDVLDFLWCVGFARVPVIKADSWESGVLLDFSDIVHYNRHGWDLDYFGHRIAVEVLQ
ncbi:hypothetical protein HJFPF1_05019 [Paramyrothecium foliicola]|nr:hypothetical protein HJFPF1_05019 [Paramyrothecium foliicola]